MCIAVNHAAFNEVRALMGKDQAFKLLFDFARDLKRRFRSEAPGELALDAHAMILSAGMFGFDDLVCMCRELEEACRQGRETEALRTSLDQTRWKILDEIDWLHIEAYLIIEAVQPGS